MKVGCFGGGTGLPSVLGGLKQNPWLDVNAIVTMFDSGGSSGQLRDELGVLPPGDVLKCALALARNEREARRLLLSRLPTLEDSRLAGHTGGNLLLSMMEQYSGSFLAGVEGLRALLGCRGRVWPVSIERASLCARYADGATARGEVDVDTQLDRGHAFPLQQQRGIGEAMPRIHQHGIERKVTREEAFDQQLVKNNFTTVISQIENIRLFEDPLPQDRVMVDYQGLTAGSQGLFPVETVLGAIVKDIGVDRKLNRGQERIAFLANHFPGSGFQPEGIGGVFGFEDPRIG